MKPEAAVHCTSLSPYDLSKVVHLLLAVANASMRPPEPHERQRAIEIARCWSPEQSAESVVAIVDTAYVAARSGVDVEEVASEIADVINHQEMLRLLADLGQMAQADGHLEIREALVITQVRTVLHRAEKAVDEAAPERSPARSSSPKPNARQKGIPGPGTNGLGISA